jgi:putative nucleotidyltransferase with HDIG domain
MYIHEFCGSWMDHPFWKTRFLLKSGEDLQRIRESGISEVWVDTAKGCDVPVGQTTAEVEEQVQARLLAVETAVRVQPASLEDEIGRAYRLCERSRDAVVSMFSDARMGKAIDAANVVDLVEDISASVARHPNALISLARLKNANEYTYMHSVAVCALMIALARQLELDDMLVHEAGMAGLLHDIGKMRMPDAVLNKPGMLTDVEFDTMRGHPEAGAQVLRESDNISPLTLEVCLHHHEKVDGSGYPHRLQGEQISLFARMGAVCDVYDAITSDRPYKKGWGPAESIRKMAEWRGHFDEKVFHAFVKSVGIYPTGSLVRLESERLGVVLDQHPKSLLTPRIRVFFSARSRLPIERSVIDLSKANCGDKIVGRESVEEWGFAHIDELWSGLPGIKGF